MAGKDLWEAVAACAAALQAVLTAGAVFLATWLQDRSIRRREAAELRRRLDALDGLLMAARNEIDSAREVMVRTAPSDYARVLRAILTGPTAAPDNVRLPDLATIQQLLHALSKVQLHELSTWVLAEAALTMRQRLAEIEPVMHSILDGSAAGKPGEANPFATQLIAADKAIDVFARERERLLRAEKA
jgi:hypothetical protein